MPKTLEANSTLQLLVQEALEVLLTLQNSRTTALTDEDYIAGWRSLFLLHTLKQDYYRKCRQHLVDPTASVDVDAETQYLMENLTQLEQQVEKSMEARLEKSSLKPRLLRLTERLGFSEKEKRGLVFILLNTSGIEGSKAYEEQTNITNFMRFSGLQVNEVFEFLSPQRQHMQENLIEYDEELSANFGGGSFKMDRVGQAALSGACLSSEDYYSLDGTLLGEILSEEPTYAGMKNVDASTSPPREAKEEGELAADEGQAKFGGRPADNEEGLEDGAVDRIISSLLEDEKEVESIEVEAEGSETCYSSDLEYLEDAFDFLVNRMKSYVVNMEHDEDSPSFSMTHRKPEIVRRELEAKEKQAKLKWERRVKVTREKGGWLPRLERLSDRLGMDSFERIIILFLIGNVISQKQRKAASAFASTREIGTIFAVNCKSLSAEIECRKYFYRDSNLVRNKIVRVTERQYGGTDLTNCECTLDRRMLDFMVGLDTEMGQLAEGGTCYKPEIAFEDVVLEVDTKKLLLNTVNSYERFSRMRKFIGFTQASTYGRGLVLLFYGESGTGKTLTANALGNVLGKKVLRVTPEFFNAAGSMKEAFEFLFREAAIQDAVCFVDECESIMESRESRMQSSVSDVLAALESYNGLLVLATNRPQDIDEAIKRRISMSLHFKLPTASMRELIWKKHLSKELKSDPTISWKKIAEDFEMSGGLIKNSLVQALQFAISRSPSEDAEVVINEEDVRQACREQLKGFLNLSSADSLSTQTIVPSSGLDQIFVSEDTRKLLTEIIAFDKLQQAEHSSIIGQTASLAKPFGEGLKNCVILIHGAVGTGKIGLCCALAYECSKPIKLIPYLELARLAVSSTVKKNLLLNFFQEAQNMNAIMCVQDCELLLFTDVSENFSASTARSTIRNQLLRYNGTIVLVINSAKEMHAHLSSSYAWDESQPLPLKIATMLKFVVKVECPPAKARVEIWKRHLQRFQHPDKINVARLANRYSFTESTILSCIVRASAKCPVDQPTTEILAQVCKEVDHLMTSGRSLTGDMYS